ncbi:MAG: hypothetical protein AABX38_02880 [Candidatus Micrarchaeota archaeon]
MIITTNDRDTTAFSRKDAKNRKTQSDEIIKKLQLLKKEEVIDDAQAEKFIEQLLGNVDTRTALPGDLFKPKAFRTAEEVEEHIEKLEEGHTSYRKTIEKLDETIRAVDSCISSLVYAGITDRLVEIKEQAEQIRKDSSFYFEKWILNGVKIWDGLYGTSVEELHEVEKRITKKFASLEEALKNTVIRAKRLQDIDVSRGEINQCMINMQISIQAYAEESENLSDRLEKLKKEAEEKEEEKRKMVATRYEEMAAQYIESEETKLRAGAGTLTLGTIEQIKKAAALARLFYAQGYYDNALQTLSQVQIVGRRNERRKQIETVQDAIGSWMTSPGDENLKENAAKLLNENAYAEQAIVEMAFNRDFELATPVIRATMVDVLRSYIEEEKGRTDKFYNLVRYVLRTYLGDTFERVSFLSETPSSISEPSSRVAHPLTRIQREAFERRVAQRIAQESISARTPPPIPENAKAVAEIKLTEADIQDITDEQRELSERIVRLTSLAEMSPEGRDKEFVFQMIEEARQLRDVEDVHATVILDWVEQRVNQESREQVTVAAALEPAVAADPSVESVRAPVEVAEPAASVSASAPATEPVVQALVQPLALAPAAVVEPPKVTDELDFEVTWEDTPDAAPVRREGTLIGFTPVPRITVAPAPDETRTALETSRALGLAVMPSPGTLLAQVRAAATPLDLRAEEVTRRVIDFAQETTQALERREEPRPIVDITDLGITLPLDVESGRRTPARTTRDLLAPAPEPSEREPELDLSEFAFEEPRAVRIIARPPPIPSETEGKISENPNYIWSTEGRRVGLRRLQALSKNDTAVEHIVGYYDGGTKESELASIPAVDQNRIWEFYRNVLFDFEVITLNAMNKREKNEPIKRYIDCLKMPIFARARDEFKAHVEGYKTGFTQLLNNEILDRGAYANEVGYFESELIALINHSRFYEAIHTFENEIAPKLDRVTELADRQKRLKDTITGMYLLSVKEKGDLLREYGVTANHLKENRLSFADGMTNELEGAINRAIAKCDIKKKLRAELKLVELELAPVRRSETAKRIIKDNTANNPVLTCQILVEEVEATDGAFGETAPHRAKIIARDALVDISKVAVIRAERELFSRCIAAARKCGAPAFTGWTRLGPRIAEAWISRMAKAAADVLSEDRPTVKLQKAGQVQVSTVAGQILGIETFELLKNLGSRYDAQSDLVVDFVARSSQIEPSIERLQEQIKWSRAEFDNKAKSEDIENALALGAICKLYMQNAKDKSSETYRKAESFVDGKVFKNAFDLIRRRITAAATSLDQLENVEIFRLSDDVHSEFIDRLKIADEMLKGERSAEAVRYIEEKLTTPAKQLHECVTRINELNTNIGICERSVILGGNESTTETKEVYARFAKHAIEKDMKETIELIEAGKIKEAIGKLENLEEKISTIYEDAITQAIELLATDESKKIKKAREYLALCYQENPHETASTLLDVLSNWKDLTKISGEGREELLHILNVLQGWYSSMEEVELAQGTTEIIAKMTLETEKNEEELEAETKITAPVTKADVIPKDGKEETPELNGFKARALKFYVEAEQRLAKVLAILPKRDTATAEAELDKRADRVQLDQNPTNGTVRNMRVDRIFEESERIIVKPDPEPADIAKELETLETEGEINDLAKDERGFLNPEMIEEARRLTRSGKILEARAAMAKIREIPTGLEMEEET